MMAHSVWRTTRLALRRICSLMTIARIWKLTWTIWKRRIDKLKLDMGLAWQDTGSKAVRDFKAKAMAVERRRSWEIQVPRAHSYTLELVVDHMCILIHIWQLKGITTKDKTLRLKTYMRYQHMVLFRTETTVLWAEAFTPKVISTTTNSLTRRSAIERAAMTRSLSKHLSQYKTKNSQGSKKKNLVHLMTPWETNNKPIQTIT